MRVFAALVTLVAISASSGCSDANEGTLAQRLPNAPSSTFTPAPQPPAPLGVLAISKFVTTFDGTFVIAEYTLTETSGGTVMLESMTFEESGGPSWFVDAWCWGDDPIKVGPFRSVNQSIPPLGDYCQPRLRTTASGDSASLTVVYRQLDGTTRGTIRATASIRH